MKKILTALSLLLLSVLCFVSCSFMGSEPPSNEGEEKENLIFNTETDIYVVYNPEEIGDEELSNFTQPFFDNGITPRTMSYENEKMPHEIVIGKAGRAICSEAYTKLERMDKLSDEDTRFLIYSDGSSVCIAYDEDAADITREIALDYFVDNYLSEELVLKKGVAKETCFNLYDYLDETDDAYFTKKWASISQFFGEDGEMIVNALQAYYALYQPEKLISWFVNLFDPEICVCKGIDGEMECKGTKYCGTGGFYYSNSARDNVGYLPDAESCAQALSFIGNCGITYGMTGSGYTAVLPQWMADLICDFIYNMQESDGFFYHPQWQKDISDSRRGRDLSWCEGILKAYNVGKKYTSAKSSSYDIISEQGLPSQLGGSAVAMVSKAISVAAVEVADHLKTPEAFAAYLEALDIYNNSYSAGNTLSAQGSQILARGKEYGEILINKLNEVYEYYGNGTWHHTVNYYAINGVMKITGSYGRWKAAIPNGELTCLAAFAAIGSDEEVKHIVDIWNPWVAVNNTLSNIKNYAKDADTYERVKSSIYAEAAEAIYDTRDKLSLFLKDDGSFSYQKNQSSATSQGCPVAIPGTNEGDVNATVIATNNFTNEVFDFLGVSRVAICYRKERLMFLEACEHLSPIVKQGGNGDIGDPVDFDYDDIGYEPTGVNVTENGEAVVVKDPRGEGNVLSFTTHKGSSDNIVIYNKGTVVNATNQVFEGEFCFESINDGDELFRFEFGKGGDKINVYRIITRVSKGVIKLYDSSSSAEKKRQVDNLGLSVKKGEWFKLRVEYYVGDHDSVRIKVYFNDKLAVITDNYYDYNGKKITEGKGKPLTGLKNTRIYMLKDCEATLLCDNLYSYGTRDPYKVEPLAEEYSKNKNVDARLLVEEGTEVGKRIPVRDLQVVGAEEGTTLSTLKLINKPVLIFIWDNVSKQYLKDIETALAAYSDKMSVYAVCNSDYGNSALGYINNNLPDSYFNFVVDERAEGAEADTYFTLVGGGDSYPRLLLLNKDSIITCVNDGVPDIDSLISEVDKLSAK